MGYFFFHPVLVWLGFKGRRSLAVLVVWGWYRGDGPVSPDGIKKARPATGLAVRYFFWWIHLQIAPDFVGFRSDSAEFGRIQSFSRSFLIVLIVGSYWHFENAPAGSVHCFSSGTMTGAVYSKEVARVASSGVMAL